MTVALCAWAHYAAAAVADVVGNEVCDFAPLNMSEIAPIVELATVPWNQTERGDRYWAKRPAKE